MLHVSHLWATGRSSPYKAHAQYKERETGSQEEGGRRGKKRGGEKLKEGERERKIEKERERE